MTLIDVYTYFSCNWHSIHRVVGCAPNGYLVWIKRGSIPYKTQIRIEAATGGALKAKLEDDLRTKIMVKQLGHIQTTRENE